MSGEGKNLYMINMSEKKGMSEVRICENVTFVLFYIPLKQLIVNKKLCYQQQQQPSLVCITVKQMCNNSIR